MGLAGVWEGRLDSAVWGAPGNRSPPPLSPNVFLRYLDIIPELQRYSLILLAPSGDGGNSKVD